MTVNELIELLKTVDPDMEVTIIDRSRPFLDKEYTEYRFDADDVTVDAYYGVSIGVD